MPQISTNNIHLTKSRKIVLGKTQIQEVCMNLQSNED